jgi:site-specific recombinase XerD
MDAFDAATIQRFLVDHTRNRSSEYARLLATALRSFFRFLFLRGYRSTDLSRAVPTVCTYRNATVPAFLSPEHVAQVLAATDRSTPVGRRDYAILLLLARLGLRAGEVANLELDDICWRTGELVIRGKGRVIEHLPLLADVGKALAHYLRTDHRTSASRRVFLRAFPPHVGLSGPSVVGDLVCRRLADAKAPRSGRGAAHLFRHGLATHMIRRGASLPEIAEVLRHRSQTTTAIYTHVSFETLRTVARPWPTTAGKR